MNFLSTNRATDFNDTELRSASGLELLQLALMSSTAMKARIHDELDRRSHQRGNHDGFSPLSSLSREPLKPATCGI